MSIRITNKSYNGAFGSTSAFIGNSGDWKELVIDIKVAAEITFDSQNQLEQEDFFKLKLLNQDQFRTQGFREGDAINLKATVLDISTDPPTLVSNYNTAHTINSILGNVIEVTPNLQTHRTYIWPSERNERQYHTVSIYSTKQFSSFDITYNQLINSSLNSPTLNSVFDGSESGFKAENVVVGVVSPVTMSPIGNLSGHGIKTSTIEWVSTDADGFHQNYKIKMLVLVGGVFDNILNFQSNTLPDWFDDNECLTDNFRIRAFESFNDPNTFVSNKLEYTALDGNTGWFNEIFNNTDIVTDSIVSVDYEVSGNPVTSIDYTQPTDVTIVYENSSFTSLKFGFFWTPIDEAIIKDLATPLHENIILNTAGELNVFASGTYAGPYDGYGDKYISFSNIDISFSSPNVTVSFTVTPNSEFTNYFSDKEGDRGYVLFVSSGDYSQPFNLSRSVNLIADFAQMERNILPVGEWEDMTNTFLRHHENQSVNDGLLTDDGFIHDDILCMVDWSQDISSGTIVTGQIFKIEAEKAGLKTELESFYVDLTSYPILVDAPNYSFSDERGFLLNNGNNKNFVKVSRYDAIDSGTLRGYRSLYAFKVRWEEWIKRLDYPSDLYDPTLISDGQSNDWVRFIDEGYDIKFTVYTEATTPLGDNVVYENEFPFTFKRNDLNVNITTTHNYYNDFNNIPLNIGLDTSGRPLAVIADTDKTRLEIDFTKVDLTPWDIDYTEGVVTIEVDNGVGEFSMRQISTVWDVEFDNPLRPLQGGVKLSKSLPSPSVYRLSCLIDPNKMEPGGRFRVTARNYVIDPPEQYFEFFTNFNPDVDGTFDPSVIGGTGHRWLFEDGSEILSNSVSTINNGLNGTTQAVRLYADDLSEIITVNIQVDNVVGQVDTSVLTGAEQIVLPINSGITSFILSGGANINLLNLRQAGISGEIDLSNRDFERVSSQSTLNLESTNVSSVLISNSTNSTHTLDIRDTQLTTFPFDKFNEIKSLQADRAPLNGVIDLTSIGQVEQVSFISCNQITKIDCSATIVGVNSSIGILAVNACSSLNEIIFKTGQSDKLRRFFAQGSAINNLTNLGTCVGMIDVVGLTWNLTNMGLNQGEIDQILVDLDTIKGFGIGSGTISILSGNATPSGIGIAAIFNLNIKGITVV